MFTTKIKHKVSGSLESAAWKSSLQKQLLLIAAVNNVQCKGQRCPADVISIVAGTKICWQLVNLKLDAWIFIMRVKELACWPK